MYYTHCISPEFLANNIIDENIFTSIFLNVLLEPNNQIVLDEVGSLELEYLNGIGQNQDAFRLYEFWMRRMNAKNMAGKILKASPRICQPIHNYVVALISCAVTTHNKTILTSDNNIYSSYQSSLINQRISLLNECNIQLGSGQPTIGKKMSFSKLDYDIAWSLERLVRIYKKGNTEDENNDLLREYLLAKEYEVKDQSREGVSSSKKSAGELDIIIENNRSLFAIIEAMRLESLDKTYIFKHYQKLLINYNPLNIKRLFMITYYEGRRFEEWWASYQVYINGLQYSVIDPNNTECSFISVEESQTGFGNVKKAIQHGIINGEQFSLIHYAVKITR